MTCNVNCEALSVQLADLHQRLNWSHMDVTSEVTTQLSRILDSLLRAAPRIMLAIVIFFLLLAIASLLRSVIRRATQRRIRRRHLGIVLARLSYGVGLVLAILIAISIAAPSFKAADIVQILGIGSVAIGFAFRDIAQNFLAGILLLTTEPFREGDQIIIKEFEGTVEDIQTRATTIRTYDGRRVVMPNAELFTNAVTVNTAYEHRRSEYDVGIGYGDDVEKARGLITNAVAQLDEVLHDPPPEVLMYELADCSVKLKVFWWTAPPSRLHMLRTRDRVLSVIKSTLSENGIDLPFPTRQVLFHDQTEATDGDRSTQREGWPAGKDPVPASRGIALAIRDANGAVPPKKAA